MTASPTPPAQAMTAEEFVDHIYSLSWSWDVTRDELAVDVRARDTLLLAAARQTWEAERAQLVEQVERLTIPKRVNDLIRALRDERAALLRRLEDMAVLATAARRVDKAIASVHGLGEQLTTEDAGLTINATWIDLRNALKKVPDPSDLAKLINTLSASAARLTEERDKARRMFDMKSEATKRFEPCSGHVGKVDNRKDGCPWCRIETLQRKADRLTEDNKRLREALETFASDATLFPNAPADRRHELRPHMYFAISDYDRAREALRPSPAASLPEGQT